MPVQACLGQFESPISLVQPLEDSKVAFITASHELFVYDPQTQTKEKLLHLNIPEEVELLYAFDPAGMRLLFGSVAGEVLHLIDLQQKKTLNRFELDHQSPTLVAFSPDGAHIVCGTSQGRVLLWRSDSSTLIARLHSFPEYTTFYTKPTTNFVSAIAFDGSALATSGYGGSIVVTNYQSQTGTKRFHPGPMKNHALLFHHDAIILGNQEGTILKIDRNGKYPTQRLPTGMGAISHLLRIGPEPYVIAVSEQRHVALFDARTMKMVNERYIELDAPISAVAKDDSQAIYLGTRSGELYRCDPLPLKNLEALIASRSYAQAYRFCDEEPLLQESESYRQLETLFRHAMESARLALEHDRHEQASALIAPFAPAKPKETAELFSAYSAMKRFVYLYENRRFAPFYGLAEQHPLLQSTALYQQVEKQWSERFIKAQRFMLLGKTKEAIAEVELFATVNTKRPIIDLLIHHIDVFKTYSKSLQQRDYAKLNQLTKRFPALRHLPSYAQLIEEAGSLPDAIMEALKSRSFEQANLFLLQLSEIVQYEENYLSLKQFASRASHLSHAMERRHWRSAYQLLDLHPELLVLPWAQELEEEWHRKVLRCETYAAKGDIHSIKQELGILINLPGRHERIGDILRMAYQVQLKFMLRKNHPNIADGIAIYCEIFGVDTELRALLKKAKRLKIDVEIDPVRLYPKKRDHWLLSARNLPDTVT